MVINGLMVKMKDGGCRANGDTSSVDDLHVLETFIIVGCLRSENRTNIPPKQPIFSLQFKKLA